MNNPNAEANLTHTWRKGESGNPKGRPKDRVAALLRTAVGQKRAAALQGVTRTERDKWLTTLYTADLAALQVLAKLDDAPAFVRTYAVAMLYDIKAGKTTTVDRIGETLFGKTSQRLELTGADGEPLQLQPVPPTPLTEKQAKKYLADLYSEL